MLLYKNMRYIYMKSVINFLCINFLVILMLTSVFSCKDRQNEVPSDQPADTAGELETGEKPIDREAEEMALRYSKKTAIAMAQLKRGVAFAEANGIEKLVEVLKNPRDPRRSNFVSGDYYIWIFRSDFKTNAVVIAHPINKAIENRDFFAIKDADGKLFIKDMLRIANYKGKGWVSYKWAHPKTMKAEAKLTYLYRMGDYILSDGFYLND